MSVNPSSGIYVVETDLSDVIASVSSSVGAIVFASKRGPVNQRIYSTTPKRHNDTFGKPDSKVSFGHYQALEFLNESSSLWSVRVVGAGALYGGVLLQKKSSANASLFAFPHATPDGADLAVPINGSTQDSEENQSLFYAIGPGAYAGTIQLEIVSKNMLPVGTVTAVPATTGGVLAAGSYSYDVTAVNSSGETIASVATATTTGTTGAVALNWAAVVGASQYRVYGRTAGSKLYLGTTTAITYTDTGAAVPGAASAPSDYVGTDEFQVNVYDTAVSSAKPVESYTCSLRSKLDGFNQQMELAAVINMYSSNIRVQNRASSFSSTPAFITSIGKTALTGGADGGAVTDSLINQGWELFRDTSSVTVNILINGGYASPAVHLQIDSIAKSRMDSIAVLDVPSNQQSAVAAVSYRQTLGLDSNYSALYTPDLYVQDNFNGQAIYLPPAGHMAAIYARTDRVAEPWYAPAGLNRGGLSVLGIRNVYDQGDRDLLQQAQVNYVRKFPAQGYAVMEAYTLQTKLSALSFIPVRRMLNVIEVATGKALLYKLWEPNDDFVRRQIVGMISEYLTMIQQRRGILRFTVVCDASNNGTNSYGNGTLNVDVYIEPTLPIARVKLQMVITKNGMSFTEAASLAGSF